MLIDIIAGARPNFMKIAPIVHSIKKRQSEGGPLRYRLVHTGQHYDARMSEVFFEQLGIPTPDVNLGAGSGTQSEQTAAIMVGYEALLQEAPAALCLVVGDVNSTMACAIVAKKLQIPVAHVEAGIRSNDRTMPEEINRLVTDSITDWFFTTSEVANQHLRQSGIPDDRIFFVGNTMIDTLLTNMDRFERPDFFDDLDLAPKKYCVATLHRPANVDQSQQLLQMLVAIAKGARSLPVIVPVHPRTATTLREFTDLPGNVHLVDPQPYLQFNWLVQNAFAVITDSGGITEETTVMGVPCMTLRDNTERPETIDVGTNVLIGTNPRDLAPAFETLFAGSWKKGAVPEKWDGKTGPRIIADLETCLLG